MNNNEELEVKQAMELLKSKGFNVNILLTTDSIDALKDPTLAKINELGYITNQRLHRRFITAQMLSNMGYDAKTNKFKSSPYTRVKNRLSRPCIISEMRLIINEYKALAKQYKYDVSAYDVRKDFINDQVIRDVVDSYVYSLRNKRYEDWRVNARVSEVLKATNPRRKLDALKDLYQLMLSPSCRPGYGCLASEKWVDAFNGEGAYYAMDNLIKYSGLKLVEYETDRTLDRDESLAYLEKCKKAACETRQFYKLVARMRTSIEKNGFNHW